MMRESTARIRALAKRTPAPQVITQGSWESLRVHATRRAHEALDEVPGARALEDLLAGRIDHDDRVRGRDAGGPGGPCGTLFGEEVTLHPLLVGLAIAFVLWVAAIVVLVAIGRIGVARELIGLVPNMLLLFKDLVRDERVPRSAKLWLGFAAVWLASPIDLIPEFVPVLGPLDDAVVAAAVLRHLVRKAGSEVVYEHWRGEPPTLSRVLRLFGASDPLSREGEG